MSEDVIILLTDDDDGHARLITKNLNKVGLLNRIIHFTDGQEILDFLFMKGDGLHRESGKQYVLLLDINMPKVNGREVLIQLKSDNELMKIPVVMVTTTDDPVEVELCHSMGCSNYITKPVDYTDFVEAIRRLGLFINIVTIPRINGDLRAKT